MEIGDAGIFFQHGAFVISRCSFVFDLPLADLGVLVEQSASVLWSKRVCVCVSVC